MMISGSTLDTNSCPLNVVELECQFPNLLPIQTFSPSSPDVFISTRGCRLTININMCYNINKLLSFFFINMVVFLMRTGCCVTKC